MKKEHIRAHMKNHFLLGLAAMEIHRELIDAYGRHCVPSNAVARSIRKLTREQDSFDNNARNDRPVTAIKQDIIRVLNELINDDAHMSIDQLAPILTISHESVNLILNHRVCLRKLS